MARAPIVMVSYWTPPVTPIVNAAMDEGVFIRHTSVADAAYICGCQVAPSNIGPMPSACVWMVPPTAAEIADF